MDKKRLNRIFDIGSLDRKVTIHAISVTYDDYGAEVETESDTEVWANVKWKTNKEGEDQGDLKGNYEISVAIRYTSGITTKDRLTFDSRVYDIVGYRELGRRRFIILDCESYG